MPPTMTQATSPAHLLTREDLRPLQAKAVLTKRELAPMTRRDLGIALVVGLTSWVIAIGIVVALWRLW